MLIRMGSVGIHWTAEKKQRLAEMLIDTVEEFMTAHIPSADVALTIDADNPNRMYITLDLPEAS